MRVPTYNGPQVQEQALRGGFQEGARSDAPFGGTAGRQLEALGNAGLRAQEQVAQVFDRRAATEADEADAEITTSWLQWDAENRSKFTGKTAGGYNAAAKEWWDNASRSYGEKLSPLAKQRITAALMRKRGTALANATGFDTTEVERHADNAAESSANASIQMAVATGDTATGALEVRRVAEGLAERKRWDENQKADYIRGKLDAMHGAYVVSLAARDAGAAAQYVDNAIARNELSSVRSAQLRETIAAESDNQSASRNAAEWAAMPLAEQLGKAAEIESPRLREKTLVQIRNNQALVKEAQAAGEKQASDQAWQMVGQGKRVPEALLATMDGRERVQLQEFLRASAERRAKGPEPVRTNPVELAKVYDMMRDDPEGFKSLRLVALTNSISGSDIEQIARVQRDMLKPDSAKDVATTAQLLGTYTGGWKPEKKAAFQGAALDELNRFEKDKKRPATYEEKKNVFDRMVVEGEVLSGAWYKPDPNRQYFEASPEERRRFRPDIQSGDRKLIREALVNEGVANPTEAQILERFKLAKGFK